MAPRERKTPPPAFDYPSGHGRSFLSAQDRFHLKAHCSPAPSPDSSLSSTDHSQKTALLLCYECGELVTEGGDYQMHILHHESAALSQQMVHSEVGKLRRFREAQRLREEQEEREEAQREVK